MKVTGHPCSRDPWERWYFKGTATPIGGGGKDDLILDQFWIFVVKVVPCITKHVFSLYTEFQ